MVARKTTAWLHDGRRKYVIELTGQSTKGEMEGSWAGVAGRCGMVSASILQLPYRA